MIQFLTLTAASKTCGGYFLLWLKHKCYSALRTEWYYALRHSDIFVFGKSDIIFATKTRESNITWTLVQLSLRSNITRHKANITEKTLVLSNKSFFWDQHSKWSRYKNLIFFFSRYYKNFSIFLLYYHYKSKICSRFLQVLHSRYS